jgi:hypothetical protein
MSKLSPDEPSIAESGANPGGRKSAAQEARGAQTLALTSPPAATPVRAGESKLRVCRPQPSEPFIENLKLGTA